LHVAKHREHDAHDFAAALRATERARALAERSRLFGRRDRLVERDLSRRATRLRRRLAAALVEGGPKGDVARLSAAGPVVATGNARMR
jgi:hypothetical protein